MENKEMLLKDVKDLVSNMKDVKKVGNLNIPETSRFNKIYATRVELNSKIKGIYEGIMFLPLKGEFKTVDNVLEVESNDKIINNDYKLIKNYINEGDEIDIATGNIHPKSVINADSFIEYDGIKQFVLVRPETKHFEEKNIRHWGPYYKDELEDGENEKDYYKYICEDDGQQIYVPKYAFYPRPDENVELRSDDDEIFKDISNNMNKEVEKDGIKYIGISKAFVNFLKEIE